MTVKTAKILYRVTTIALTLFILPGLFFMNSEMAMEGMKHVGLTDAKRLQQLLGYASPLAILAILIPKVPNHLKEWAYAGLVFIYIGAFWAHYTLKDPISMTVMPLVTLAITLLSHYCWHKMSDNK